ncbi:MAG TPA: pectinesterase family protein [Acidobacteriaceae bacterium]
MTATDALGDGCLATQVGLSLNLYGVAADNVGNVFVLDQTNAVIHKIDGQSGIMTRAAGGATTVGCSGQADKYGDNCLAATQTGAFASTRGLTTDPYGNLIIGGYSMNLVQIVCNTVSPLCTSAQVGYMRIVAGYSASSSATGTAAAGSTPGSAGDGTTAVGTSGTGVNQPRGAAADIYGNVYIADTANTRYRVVVGPASYNGVPNPLASVIALSSTYSSVTASTAAGKIYPILGPTTAVAAGSFCNGTSGAKSLDASGDGCPFFSNSITSSTSSYFGVITDSFGNAIFVDSTTKTIRVLYMGGAQMAAAIVTNNSGKANWVDTATSLNVGSIYAVAGGGASGISTTATLGSSTILNAATRVAVDGAGNIYTGDNTNFVTFFDIKTGYVRQLFKSGTVCSGATNSIGDGCLASQSTFGVGSPNTLALAVDNQGNIILADSINSRVRKVSASSLVPMTVATSATQNIVVHEPAGVTGVTAALSTPSPDITVGSASCAAANADSTLDCTIPLTLLASAPGVRSAGLVVTPAGSITTPAIFPLGGTAAGTALVTDAISSSTTGAIANATSTLGTLTPLTVAVDGANNVYSVDSATSRFSIYTPGVGSTLLTATAPSGVSQTAVDTQGNIYAVGSGSASITKLTVTAGGAPPTYSAGTVSYTPSVTPAKPQGVAVNASGSIYVSDGANGAVYELSQSSSATPPITIATGFSNPTLLALGNNGKLYVYDAGASTLYQIAADGTKTSALTGITITGMVTDAAGNSYVQTATGVMEYPRSGPATVTVYSGGTSPNGIAVDGNGNLYISDAGNTGIVKVARNAFGYGFNTDTTSIISSTITNAGNLNAAGWTTTSTLFNFAGGTSSGCNVASTTAAGTACTITMQFNSGAGSGVVTDAISFTSSGATTTANTGSTTYTGTLGGAAITTTTAIGNQTPANPIYAATGTEVSFDVTVTASSGTATGNITYTLDTNTPVSVALNGSGVATVSLSGVTAGTHSITASFASQNGMTGSSTVSATSFTVTKAATTVSWTPTTTTQPYSTAMGTAVLNATATAPGAFIYTATPSGGGTAQAVHSASYLPIGAYSLEVTFVPTDSTNYTQSTGSVVSYTVTQANTTAAVGATQMLVAADGTGNYSTVQAAVNKLTSGGSVYIKPGTYNAFVTVVQPNVALRGLGGDPTKVVLTRAAGAFGSSYPYVGEFTAANSNGSQLPSGSSVFTGDEGSATLVVAKGVNTALSTATTIPNGFYSENLSLVNTYDTDTTTTTTTYHTVSTDSCIVNQPIARTYADLYNSGLLCGSQALVIWMTSDLAMMNNVFTTSQQDTIYAASQGSGSNGYVPSRQYWFRGKVAGDVDFIFGDAAAVFDSTSIYTTWHGSTATGTETIHAQNKATQTGGANDYLSGYVMNNNVFTSQSTGMTSLYFGRPYGTYSTWVMLNASVDQVNPLGYTTGLGPSLSTTTFLEYNTMTYTDPATGSADLNGIPYLGTSGNTGSGASGPRETSSLNPGTPEANNVPPTALTLAQAQAFYPNNFLGQTVPSAISSTQNWVPTTAFATAVNAFVPSATTVTVNAGGSITILMRPQTPGLGAISNGTYTIPTGTYTLKDGTTTLASGTLDASGEAYYTTSSLAAGSHSITWTYGGDSNFVGSTTVTPLTLNVTGGLFTTTTTLAVNNANSTYGAAVTGTVTVAPTSGSGNPAGTVTLLLDSAAAGSCTLNAGSCSFSLAGITATSHTLAASYGGDTNNSSSTSGSTGLSVAKAVLTLTATSSSRTYGQPNSLGYTLTGFAYSETQASATTGSPSITTTATQTSAVATYPITAAVGTLVASNYTITTVNGILTVTGGATQRIFFPALPNFPIGGPYELTARTNAGQTITYTVTAGSSLASVSGTVLTVTGAGSITITADAAPINGFNAATTVSRTFTSH